MVEKVSANALEAFKHPVCPFLFAVDDATVVRDILQSLPETYGLEVGFGREPTSVFQIDSTIPWILTEPDSFRFRHFKDETRQQWLDLKPESLQIHQPIVALHAAASVEIQKQAHILVYRNIDYQEMDMISFADLQEKQRLVFIVDGDHIPEMPTYGSFLQRHGYEVKQFKRRSLDVPQFTFPYPFYPNDYVLDVTK